jgi:hypothetical protein
VLVEWVWLGMRSPSFALVVLAPSALVLLPSLSMLKIHDPDPGQPSAPMIGGPEPSRMPRQPVSTAITEGVAACR